MSAGVRGFGPMVGALALGALIVLLLAACGGKSSPSATNTTTTTSAAATTLPATPAAKPASCSAWGTEWAKAFNKGAVKQGNPERMLAACCSPKNGKGVSHCVLTLTLVGTNDRGCEAVDLGPAGTPVSVGRHVLCDQKA